MSESQVLYEVSEGIATVTLNRPERLNAWTGTMGAELRVAMEKAEADPEVRAIILTGAGRGFCAGADMDALQGIGAAGGTQTPRAFTPFDPGSKPDFHHPQAWFPTVGKPIIGAVNGPCAGMGMALVLFCDLRFCTDDTVFVTAFSRRGLIAEHGISWMLSRLTGHSRALDLLLSSRRVTGPEAYRIGLADRLVAPDQLMAEARAYCRELVEKVSPRSMRVMKKQLWEDLLRGLGEALKEADREMVESLKGADFKEGVAHFVEKRAPRFTGA
ncbi:enoyl-CoA hydratase [uncultured Phenylobacterium sp.]|uniref:enoyl-CoA hydratase n=1 Tax=uncultured Phenylobacterium sp. TaxID=349273 RepID=UPI0025E04391|nr:enoyl-CoA hydratase [uncultured Phenylobacterium sp.]